jgi:Protein of unknown function with HXXEE motif
VTTFFSTGWPWVGLVLAPLLLALLFLTDIFRSDTSLPRFRDLYWLAWLAVPTYLIHQFEEHGIDFMGHPYAFRGSLCGVLGYPDALSCPIPVSFITAVNLSAVWCAIPLSAFMGRKSEQGPARSTSGPETAFAPVSVVRVFVKRPLVALSAFAIPMVNAVAHIGPGVLQGHYNPGVGTAVFLFVPLSLWAVRNALLQRAVTVPGVFLVLVSGILIHLVLLGSLLLFIHGKLGEILLSIVQVGNGFLPFLLAFRFSRVRQRTGMH